jgi:hypothetical protein
MTDVEYEGMLRRWKQGTEDVFRAASTALADNKLSGLEIITTGYAGMAFGLMIRQDCMSMTVADRMGMLSYLERAELKVP